ncbi:MAG TPA: OmpA family protein [Blastocatellia bacterium]|nr:OmpA family protein [Blastocatellia bacterium]
MRKFLTLILLMFPLFATLRDDDKPPAQQRNFVACPIVRDTKTLPCWLAEYEGELYFLGLQGSSASEFYPPQLNHEVLVEGTVTNDPRICGGIPLKPVRISVMAELNRGCNTLLPAEDGMEAPAAPARRFVDSMRAPGADTAQRDFTVPFDFDSDYLTLHTTRILSEAVRVAKAVKATKIEVQGYRATTWLSNGKKLIEAESIAAKRAKKIGEILTGLGLASSAVSVHWKTEPEPCDGVTDPDKRRVTIKIIV